MPTFRVYVTGTDADDVSVGSWFTLEADDDVDAANEAVTAARDCGWTDTETTRVILADHRPAPEHPDHDEQERRDLAALRRAESAPLEAAHIAELQAARRAASRRLHVARDVHGAKSPHTVAARAAHNAISAEIARRQQQQQPTASERIRAARDRDEHSGSRRLEVLEQEAPHLIAAPDVVADLHRYAHELADAAINGAAGGYAETDEESDRRAALRDDLEGRLYSIARLETIRGELRAERVSYGELAELQSLAAYIEPDDVELLEAAGIPEHDDDATE